MVVARKARLPYRVIDHTSDIGFDVCGKTRKDLFHNAATALLNTIVDPSTVAGRDKRPVTVTGSDLDDLWINYLRELLYLANGDRFLIHDVSILRLSNRGLSLVVTGEPYDPKNHDIITEIKAVTYHQAMVRKAATYGWCGRFIVDV